MAKIFISHSNADKEYVLELSDKLKDFGQDVVSSHNLSLGDDWQYRLVGELRSSDIFIIILSDSSVSSEFVLSELNRSIYLHEDGRISIIPIAISDIDVPFILRNHYVLFSNGRSIDKYIGEIISAIYAFSSAKIDKIEKAKIEEAEEKKKNIANYVDSAIEEQKKYENLNKTSAKYWYFIGFLVLIISLFIYSALYVYTLNSNNYILNSKELLPFLSTITAKVILAAILAALVKYAFTIGRTFMAESLKSSDRIHAIRFGKFFLEIFGDKLDPNQVKDAFQHWNIDRDLKSSLGEISSIDPKIVEILSKVVENLSSKVEPQKK